MARIGIINCSNCTQETDCASVVCLGDMRKRKGLFERYPKDEPLDIVGIISCAGCPTMAAPEKILKRVRALAEFKINALHFSYHRPAQTTRNEASVHARCYEPQSII